MDLNDWPIFVVMGMLAVGFCLMTVAFILIAKRGGWQKAMQGDDQSRWTLPRRLMATGALLGAIAPLLTLIPGVVPWWDRSKGNTGLYFVGGVVGAAFLIGITVLIQRRRG